MNKKGFIFTTSTILLFFSVFVLANVFLDRTEELKHTVVRTSVPEKIRYVEDDIVSNIYTELLPLNVSIERNGGLLTINFSETIYLQNSNHFDADMQPYKTFVEGNYASLLNLNITLINFSANLTIEPYNSKLDLDENSIYIYNDPTHLNKITLLLKTDEANYEGLEEEFTVGDVSLAVILLNETGSIIYDESSSVDETIQNKLKFVLGGGNSVQIRFGSFDSYPDATLELTNDIYTEIREFVLKYTEQPAKTVLKGGKVEISSVIGNVSRKSEIILVEE